MGFLEWLKKFFDLSLLGIPVFTFLWIFIGVAFAPPHEVFNMQVWIAERSTAVNILGQNIFLPNLVWIYILVISGSIGTRVLGYGFSVLKNLLGRFDWSRVPLIMNEPDYLEMHDIKRFPEEE